MAKKLLKSTEIWAELSLRLMSAGCRGIALPMPTEATDLPGTNWSIAIDDRFDLATAAIVALVVRQVAADYDCSEWQSCQFTGSPGGHAAEGCYL